MRHVSLQRVARGFIEVDQLARQVGLDLRDLIKRIDLGVIDDGHVEPVVDGFFHEDAVKHASRVGVQPEGNVAYTQDGFDLRQLLLDPLDRVERLDAGGAVLFLPRRNGQSERVKNQVGWADAIFLSRQFVDALGDGSLFLRGKRHAIFVDGQSNYGSAVTFGHRQDFRGALLAVFQIDGVDDGFSRDALQRLLDDVGFSGIDQNRRGHTRRDLFQNRADVALLVFADHGATQVKHVRSLGDQLLRKGQNVVILAATHHVAERFHARGGVHLFVPDQRLSLAIDRAHAYPAG